MSTLGEIESAINVLELAGTCRAQITVCIAPPNIHPLDEVNLRAIQTIRQSFGVVLLPRSH